MFNFSHASERDGSLPGSRPTEIGSISQVTPTVRATPEKRSAVACLMDGLRNCGKGENLESYLAQEAARGDADARRAAAALNPITLPRKPLPSAALTDMERVACAIARLQNSTPYRRIK